MGEVPGKVGKQDIPFPEREVVSKLPALCWEALGGA